MLIGLVVFLEVEQFLCFTRGGVVVFVCCLDIF